MHLYLVTYLLILLMFPPFPPICISQLCRSSCPLCHPTAVHQEPSPTRVSCKQLAASHPTGHTATQHAEPQLIGWDRQLSQQPLARGYLGHCGEEQLLALGDLLGLNSTSHSCWLAVILCKLHIWDSYMPSQHHGTELQLPLKYTAVLLMRTRHYLHFHIRSNLI